MLHGCREVKHKVYYWWDCLLKGSRHTKVRGVEVCQKLLLPMTQESFLDRRLLSYTTSSQCQLSKAQAQTFKKKLVFSKFPVVKLKTLNPQANAESSKWNQHMVNWTCAPLRIKYVGMFPIQDTPSIYHMLHPISFHSLNHKFKTTKSIKQNKTAIIQPLHEHSNTLQYEIRNLTPFPRKLRKLENQHEQQLAFLTN